ncbi:hypothetical protein ACH5RR_034719 [Cinchona calisaya]|uniref:Hydroxyproline-rich glycoprotein family protein n=1 Tax=Cinchona calisaya TaxID=153742 RepID=A0ABD2YCX4_9GENT
MEESEKRRERLKAMRMEAAEAGVHGDAGNSVGASCSLSNPLVEASVPPPVHGEPTAAPRFDYYTDPMAAFSANKRRSKVSHQTSPDYFTPPRPSAEMIPPPAYQVQTTYSLNQRMFQPPGPYHSSHPFGSPSATPNPFGTPQGRINVVGGSTSTPTYFPPNLPRGGNSASPGFVQIGSPSFSYGQGRGYGLNNSPQTGSGNWRSPLPYSGRGRSQWQGHNSPQTGPGNQYSPYSHSGRGRGRSWGTNNPGSVSGRKVDSRDRFSAEVRPDQYYDKSMVEDPWEMLKPILWRRKDTPSLDTPDFPKSWLPKSISSKKPQVSEPSNNYSSGRSFAEDLAASFHAATNSELTDDNAEQNL